MEYIHNTANPEDWDVIAIQEPWLDHLGNTQANQYWRVLYLTNHLNSNQAPT